MPAHRDQLLVCSDVLSLYFGVRHASCRFGIFWIAAIYCRFRFATRLVSLLDCGESLAALIFCRLRHVSYRFGTALRPRYALESRHPSCHFLPPRSPVSQSPPSLCVEFDGKFKNMKPKWMFKDDRLDHSVEHFMNTFTENMKLI